MKYIKRLVEDTKPAKACPKCSSKNITKYTNETFSENADHDIGGTGFVTCHRDYYVCNDCGCRFYEYEEITTLYGTCLLKDDYDEVVVTLSSSFKDTSLKVWDLERRQKEDEKVIKSICNKYDCHLDYNFDYSYDEDALYDDDYNEIGNKDDLEATDESADIIIQGHPANVLMVLKEMYKNETVFGGSTWVYTVEDLLNTCKEHYNDRLIEMAEDEYSNTLYRNGYSTGLSYTIEFA